MANKVFPKSQLPIRRTVDFLPQVFQTDTNDKFLNGIFDPLIQPGVLEKTVGYVGRRYGKTFNGTDVYLDTDNTLRSRYQLEPGVITKTNGKTTNFYDYLDLKNILNFFGNLDERDDLVTHQKHYSWNPPIDWDKFINYREYYWVPSGPPSIRVYGLNSTITSSYRVKLSEQSSFIFFPDGYTNNPTITLYRGQKYKFVVNAPGNGLTIRTSYDTGSMLYDPDFAYPAGSVVVFDGGLWRAKSPISPGDGSTIDLNNQDWEFLESSNSPTALDYNNGVTNNGIEVGTVTFEIPYDAPDVLYYQSRTDPNRFGRFIIEDIISNTKLDIEKDIVGKIDYTSGNGIALTNGLIVSFGGTVLPTKYAKGDWLVEGVGTGITLTEFDALVIPILNKTVPDVLFDNEGFDSLPFDDASSYPGALDYLTIAKSSQDANPWSRYNRWFHRSVLEYAYSISGSTFESTETSRAKRPIIEFLPNLKLYQHGSYAKKTVDYIDTFTTDIFSKIEGSTGYNIDGEDLFDGARVLVITDTDILANNQIYEVKFITFQGQKQITLKTVDDSISLSGETVLIRRGTVNRGAMYYFDGTVWNESQKKTQVNQAPLFDVFDKNGISFSDTDTYPVTTFVGTKLISYKVNLSGVADKHLGFAISHLNIDNVGDIIFTNDWDIDEFSYKSDQTSPTVKLATGFYKFNIVEEYDNGWIATSPTYLQPILDYQKINAATSSIELTTVNWDLLTPTDKIFFYLNGEKLLSTYTRIVNKFTFSTTFAVNDVLVVKVFCNQVPDTGYYEIPLGLEKNPLNQKLESFTFGQAADHVTTGLEFFEDFSGSVLGASSNLRDISGYQAHSKRFLKHENLSPVATMLLVDKKLNLIKSIRYAKKSYSDFKNKFLNTISNLNYTSNIATFVDEAIIEITKAKNNNNPFADSDMIGSGAFNAIYYTVEDVGIKIFSLSKQFDLNTLSNKAVYVYLNDNQLINTKDYEFNSTFSFVDVKVNFVEGDLLEIREYTSTAFNHIPQTPTKLGLYKKYLPRKFVDDTYVDPKEVIQGHDGSIISAFGDYRDDAILELEMRIYNNIKVIYDEELHDNDRILGGYYNTGIFGRREQLTNIINQEFLKWISDTNIDYVANDYFDPENSFTYTYSKMADPTGLQNLPGWWRGIYKWFYDTDRPHTCPWEMLGFGEKPTWWDVEYGPAPYTSNNLILWEDLSNGIIRQGPRAGTSYRYQRPSLITHIPVDADGKLLSPLDSNLAQNFSLINNQGDFKLGDQGPVENTWYISSEFPFAQVIALCLLRPLDFIGQSFDRSKIKTNKLGQTVHTDTDLFIKVEDLLASSAGGSSTSGLVSYVVDYIKSQNLSTDILTKQLESIDVALTYRMSGFVDQTQQKFILDSKNPKSTSSSIFIPAENQEIFFNVSAPIETIVYSGVIIEKTARGFKIRGYDSLEPFFYYYDPVTSQTDGLISVGGISEEFVTWSANQFYGNGIIAQYKNEFYRSLSSHTSTDVFSLTFWKKLPSLPNKNAVEALSRRTFNTNSVSKLNYGTILPTIQLVVDFIFGYEKYLLSKGFTFDRYDSDNKVTQNWTTGAKEFMYWTSHNWALGSLITLSPAGEKLEISFNIGVPDNILDSFYDYQIYRGDGTPLTPNFLNIKRDYQTVSIETTNTNDGIYFFKGFLVLKEHVAIFSDRTVFNDVVYDKTTGYRQERIKSRGFRTVDWDGDYTSPGFLYDNVNIQPWQPYVDYKLGDIVAYKAYSWASQTNQQGVEYFDNSKWSVLDSSPSKALVPNFDYRINQFSDYYDLDSDGLESSQRDLGRHSVGYQTREYLQGLAEDNVTQFQLYQGFIRDKGTINAAVKVFDKLSKTTEDSIVLNEEWAFNVGTFGGVDQLKEIEFMLDKNDLEINPQPILFVNTEPSTDLTDQYLRIPPSKFTKSAIPFDINMLPKIDFEELQTAGYVKLDQVEYILKDRDSILNINIDEIKENDHFWITFDGYLWTVLRLNKKPLLAILNATKTISSVEIFFNRLHNLSVGDIIGIQNIPNLTGFFKITQVTEKTIFVTVNASAPDPEVDQSTTIGIYGFTDARISNKETLSSSAVASLATGSKLWVDDVGNTGWQVLEKNKIFDYNQIDNYGTSNPLGAGTAVLHADVLKQTIMSMPQSSLVTTYLEGESLQIKQIIVPETDLLPLIGDSFGSSLSTSADNTWLVIGIPKMSQAVSYFMGDFDKTASYNKDDIVLQHGKLWKALENIRPDGSSNAGIDLGSKDWEPATSHTLGDSFARGIGPSNQGMVSVYKWTNNNWQLFKNILSPRPAEGENFGSKTTVGFDGIEYWMAVSAPGALNNRGRVYLYKFNGTEWVHHENSNYQGIYESGARYHAGSIVWWDDRLWQAQVDINEDSASDSTIAIESTDIGVAAEWKQIDSVSTQSSLPTNIALVDDGSTLGLGLLSPTQQAELTKQGDQFGSSIVMSKDGSILVVGAPDSDGAYYENYKGEWSRYQEYNVGDVIKFIENDISTGYYKLIDPRNWTDNTSYDSSLIYRSVNQRPTNGDPWVSVGDSIFASTGKVYVYQRDSTQVYQLKQTFTAQSLDAINDTGFIEQLFVGDKFGYAVDIDDSGKNIVVSSPMADINLQNQGSVYYFNTVSLTTPDWRLKQKLESFEEYNNMLFGSSVSISGGGERIVVGAKNAPYKRYANFADGTTFDSSTTSFLEVSGYAGQVYSFERVGSQYLLSEKLQAELQAQESFGASVDSSSNTIVVGSPTYQTTVPKIVNEIVIGNRYKIISTGTTSNPTDFTLFGAVNNNVDTSFVATANGITAAGNFILGKTYTINTTGSTSFVLAGAQDNEPGTVFVASSIGTGTGTAVQGTGTASTVNLIGIVRTFSKLPGKNSLTIIAQQQQLIDYSKIKNISLIDNIKNVKLADVDVVDHAKLKILGIAEQELKFKTPYDPAIYTTGTDSQIVSPDSSWFEANVGKLWWNLSTAKWLTYEQGEFAYRVGNWNQLAPGASIDVYEWVESILLPSEWSALADTIDGLSNGISGQPLYPNNDVYSVKEIYNPITQQLTETKYYYWVRSSSVVPENIPGRNISAAAVAALISNPSSIGVPVIAIVDSDKLLAYNFNGYLPSGSGLLNIELFVNETTTNPIHREYILLSEGVADSLPNDVLETKWIDSLVGFDQAGNPVPDSKLSEREKYGLSFRPRQSMFKNKTKILKIVVDNINTILLQSPFADTLSFRNLNLTDSLPSEKLNEYDYEVDNLTDLAQYPITRVRQAVLTANIINGEIDSIDIEDGGFGYKNAPYITIDGSGVGAQASVTLDSQGRVTSVNIITRGRRYDNALVKIRNYSVLVKSDSSINGFWAIYSWDQQRKVFYRRKSQGYNTPSYWYYVDWWSTGYTENSRIIYEIASIYLEPTLTTAIGDLIKINEYGNGGWAVLEKVTAGTGTILGDYILVGRNNGTIALKDSLYNTSTASIGYDNVGFYDIDLYDLYPTAELRNILSAVKNDLFIDNLRVEWNKLFFTSIHYTFSEQETINWAFKTSFINAMHNVGSLEQKVNYKNDNLPAFQSYLEEIKPYRTSIREYTSRYNFIEPSNTTAIDFDLPPAYSTRDGKILPVGQGYNLFDQYPWKFWADNQGFSITKIEVSESGANYSAPPTVLIEGNGIGAKAKAYIASGKVSGIVVTEPGSGYTLTPKVTLVGGNGSSLEIAKAVAILGDSKARMFNLLLKFDRISKDGIFQNFTHEQTFTATSATASFDLEYAPTRDKSKIQIYKNSQLVLNSEYSLHFYRSTVDSYSLLKGRLILTTPSVVGDIINIVYDKNEELLDGVNRVQKYYYPTSGMIGNDLGQLMTGIDFGGVQVQGTTFEITGGWDALPWFTDSWDSIDATSDYYVVIDGSSSLFDIELPYVPSVGQRISIYLKRDGKTDRLDDPYYDLYDGSTTQANGLTVRPTTSIMPSFTGDGSTFAVPMRQYIILQGGDTLIFRPFTSDGSIVINDPNLVDTNLIGGNFESNTTNVKTAPNTIDGIYSIARGKTPEEIVIDGDTFISPEQTPATEENVPGQVLDSLSIKVFQTTISGAAPMQNTVIPGDGTTRRFPIGLTVIEETSVLVYVDKLKYRYYGVNDDSTLDYYIDFVSNEIVFYSAPTLGAVVEIIAIGRGGASLIDYQEFIADGDTSLFLTQADYNLTQSVFVTVNGRQVDTGFTNSTVVSEETGADIIPEKTIIKFAINPEKNQVIKIVALNTALNADSSNQSIIQVNNQSFIYNGSATFALDRFVDLSRSSAATSMIVTLNNKKLQGPDTYYVIYDGTNNAIPIGVDPLAVITAVDIKVYINNILQPFVTAYIYTGTSKIVTVNPTFLTLQDIIKVEVILGAQYSIEANNNLVIDSTVALTVGDKLDVTWFSEYPTFNIVSDSATGGKVLYRLSRKVLDDNYVWVYVNGERLIRGIEFYVKSNQNAVYLTVPTTTNDIVELLQFGNQIYKDPRAFEIFKDMLNVTHYSRYSIGEVTLAVELRYYDTTITVNDGSLVDAPIPLRNISGTVIINNERIEYLTKTGNVLGQLRRGSLGTGIGQVYPVGTAVSNAGPSDIIAYSDNQEKANFYSPGAKLFVHDDSTTFELPTTEEFGNGDKFNLIVTVNNVKIPEADFELIPDVNASQGGFIKIIGNTGAALQTNDVIGVTSLIIGPLEYIPVKADREFTVRGDISIDFGMSDQLEIFAGGRRLRKDSLQVFDETQGPLGTTVLDPEFSVDGIMPYIRLTQPVAAGTRILIIRKVGRIWYDRAETTASTGITLLNNDNPIAKFIDQKPTELPE